MGCMSLNPFLLRQRLTRLRDIITRKTKKSRHLCEKSPIINSTHQQFDQRPYNPWSGYSPAPGVMVDAQKDTRAEDCHTRATPSRSATTSDLSDQNELVNTPSSNSHIRWPQQLRHSSLYHYTAGSPKTRTHNSTNARANGRAKRRGRRSVYRIRVKRRVHHQRKIQLHEGSVSVLTATIRRDTWLGLYTIDELD